MKKQNYFVVVVTSLLFTAFSYSQHKRYTIKNGFALGGGLTQFDIVSDSFKTKSSNGWLIHASATGNIPHKWYNISYGMQLSENTLSIFGQRFEEDVFVDRDLEYKLFAAQLSLLFHAKVVPNLLTIDFGPMLQYNGKLELQGNDQSNAYLFLDDVRYNATAIESVSPLNVNGAVGTTLGFGFLKLRAQYIYGFTNILNKLNDEDFSKDLKTLKGNQSMFTFAALITF